MERIKVLEILVNQNLTHSDENYCDDVSCCGIGCDECPLQNDDITLGDVRAELKGLTSTKDEPVKSECDDAVHQPNHYMLFEGVESIQVIARSMTTAEFKGFCLGNVLKYRLRAGKKSEMATMEKDLAKANFYSELFAKHKGECRDAS